MRKLQNTPKGYTADSDKLCAPEDTVARVKARFERLGGVLGELRRTDTGRLGIPVYLSLCGPQARAVMPTRKQMGKGASPAQAEASALMELVERFSYFSFWADEERFSRATWRQAQALWPGRVMPVAEVIRSVHDDLSEEDAESLLDLVPWRFHPAVRVADGQEVMVPLDWFKTLNEFNGSSAGNCLEESILQGACELVERHVSAVVDAEEPRLPTIAVHPVGDPVLKGLIDAFGRNGVKLWLKDFSLGMPVPTVGALAYDPATLGMRSEIVFTAGTSSSPVKAAIRAVTEIAQLAGDFETGSNYEASGLRKFQDLGEISWVAEGPSTELKRLPDLEKDDILHELLALAQGLAAKGLTLYTVETTHPALDVAANYSFVPGFLFRERTPRASLGMFVGRYLAEQADEHEAVPGLKRLEELCPGRPWLPLHKGLLALRLDDPEEAAALFREAAPLQEDSEDQGMAVFYEAYAHTRMDRWDLAAPLLDKAIALSPDVKEYHNLRGVTRFKAKAYDLAACDFEAALALDSGSAMDLANLGLCHMRLGNDDAAREFLGKALEMDPGLDFARASLTELGSSPDHD
ncbi:Ribosomal protein S12 methylthiotransferase accessory factor YcaO [Fundidesulfovibrio magnetotacticus]|uniref:Ribosomal protein S12 methylthiotransferase accessory factor YcaO n=1 Tax=Fundidesulfovibrio magnetotacticus TaxID=2730080 RepID=A0A6V8LW13_9BACT|nr:YcaO-like family protein [Fundidesulfovibrio magnetotacticus]GFK95100.1 Ribosomal protein S12 methylthiotransferase accessory factor YcaO [Fundidesulfovibrio magnetotacticus]